MAFHRSGQYACALLSSTQSLKAFSSDSLPGNPLMLKDMLTCCSASLNSLIAVVFPSWPVYFFAISTACEEERTFHYNYTNHNHYYQNHRHRHCHCHCPMIINHHQNQSQDYAQFDLAIKDHYWKGRTITSVSGCFQKN